VDQEFTMRLHAGGEFPMNFGWELAPLVNQLAGVELDDNRFVIRDNQARCRR
jgi:hypothetical protein